MSGHASHLRLSTDASWDDYEPQQFFAGEPITPRPRRGRTMLRAAMAILILFGGGYAALETRAIWEPLLPTAIEALRSLVTPPAQVSVEQKASLDTPPPPQPVESREVAEAPKVEVGTPVPPVAAENTPAATTTLNAGTPDTSAADEKASEEKPLPLPPIVVDASDPYQKRAVDVGLHPSLSRALLSRMSTADYRNAGIAIKTALAETRDSDVYVWPQNAKPKEAVFEVKFVKSVSPECRRYVVTVSKDRWSTTARAMEKCGLRAPERRVSGSR